MASLPLGIMLVLALAAIHTEAAASKKQITCYYRNWSQYGKGKAKFGPNNIDPNLCSVVKYAFLRINMNTKKIETIQPNDLEQLKAINGLKKINPDLKVMVAVGGWSHEYLPRYSTMSGSRRNRKKFIRSVITFLRRNKLDGISVNWIYPGTRHGKYDAERRKFTMLMRQMYSEFKRDAQRTRKDRLLLTATVSPYVRQIAKSYDVPNLVGVVDSVDVMMNSLWKHTKRKTGTSSAMKGTSQTIIHSLEAWLKSGMPAEKLNVGFILYGQTYTLQDPTVFSIGARTSGPGAAGVLTRRKGILGYYEICTRTWKHQTKWYDSETDTPYATDGSGLWVSYDDPDSFKFKLSHIIQKYGLNGVTLWALDFDDFTGTFCNSGKYPILHEIARTVRVDPCAKCLADEICKIVDGEATCGCSAGFYRDDKAGTCKVIGNSFESELKFDMPFTPALSDPSSNEYKNLAAKIQRELMALLAASIPNLARIEILGFQPGSVVVLFRMILSQGANLPNLDFIKAVIKQAVSSGKLGDLKVDVSHDAVVAAPPALAGTCGASVDIGFLLDSSGSVRADYSKEKSLVKVVAASLGLSQQGSRAGVITYSEDAEYSIKMSDNFDIASFSKAVDQIPLMGKTTRIDRALRLAQKVMFTQENGARDDVPDVLLFITDGTQTDGIDAEYPGYIADELRDEGVTIIIVIGVGRYVHFHELEHIAGGAENAFLAPSFEAILSDNIMSALKERACPAAPKVRKADIAFLIDVTKGSEGLVEEKKFIKAIAQFCDITEGSNHAAVATFTSRASVPIKLNEHSDVISFQLAVETLSSDLKQIGMPLSLAQKGIFNLDNGGRTGVKKIAIVVSDASKTSLARGFKRELSYDGIEVVSVTVGRAKKGRYTPSLLDDTSYNVDSYEELSQDFLIDAIGEQVCPSPDDDFDE